MSEGGCPFFSEDPPPQDSSKSLTYSSYLEIEPLLELQKPRSGDTWDDAEHDEMLFIVIHQVYELWFRQVLHELDHLSGHFEAHREDDDRTPRINHTLKRVLTILKTMVSQVDILETMTPISFASFRSSLAQASGFQSPQFRELEFVLGHRRPQMLKHHQGNEPALKRLQRRLEEPTLYQRFLRYLSRCGLAIPQTVFEFDADKPLVELPEIRDQLIEIYRQDDRLAMVCERLVDFDEGIQEWRYRHVKMVERTLGSKQGTGGSSGAAYLRSTLHHPLFPDLWAIRSDL
ncbi:MAG: tryptophan 2,3-dioxygenase family protein [Acidobacteriota bacterium]